MFDPSKFRVKQGQWALLTCWTGGGHTIDTDPTKRGWRLKPSIEGFYILGNMSCSTCFSIQRMDNDILDVVTYEETTPRDIDKQLRGAKSGACYNPIFQKVRDIPGWALPLIRFAEANQ